MKKNGDEELFRWRSEIKKIFLLMKLVCVLFFIGLLHVNAETWGQAEKVSLGAKQLTVDQVFNVITAQLKYDIFYSDDEINVAQKVEFSELTMNVEDVLRKVLGEKFDYRFVGRTIVISPRTLTSPKKGLRIVGKVDDKKKQPLPGVTVKIVGTTVGTATNAKGWFSIELPITKGTLEFSFVGYKKQQVNFTAKTDTLRIVMEEDMADLDEVQVIGYGERRKREVVSAISSVKADEIKEIPTSTFTDLLQGRMAGVEITSQSGSPGGGGTKVAIRGYNSLMVSGASDGQPLYVIDGVPMHSFTSPITGTNALAELDPATIESVEVLKDAASAAIYGSRAGNGVILITTKKGKVGMANFSANFSYSASIMPEFPEQLGGKEERRLHDLMLRNGRKAKYNFFTGESYYPENYLEAYKKGGKYDFYWNSGKKSAAGSYPILQDSLNPFYNNQSHWFKQFFRTGKVLNANIQASGGTERVRYMVGMGYYNESGINYGSDFKRANFVANLSLKPAKRITFDTRINLAYSDKSRNTKNNTFANSPSIEAMTANPGTTSTLLPMGGAVEDEILKKLNGTISRSDSYRLMFNAVLGVEFLKGLKFTSSLGLDFSQNNSNVFEPSYLNYRGDNKSTGLIGRQISMVNENLLRYSRRINEIHNFEVLVGMTYNEMQTHQMQAYALRGPSDNIYYVGDGSPLMYDYGTPDDPRPEALHKYISDYKRQIMLSYLGRVAYNYKSKYLLEATYRRDGSSVFGEDVRWANFPSVAIGWAFSEESFMQSFGWLNLGKLRASWGTSGQILNDPYLAHGLIQQGILFMGNQGMTAPMINRRLSWEESDQYDIGLDVDLFNYRLKVKMDYYYKKTKGLLYEVYLPGDMFGNSRMWENAMDISNEGLELELMGDILRESKVSWRMKFNISRNWNRFKKSYTDMDVDHLVIGRPIYCMNLYDAQGFVQRQSDVPRYSLSDGSARYLEGTNSGQYYLPGMRLLKDINGDGAVMLEDTYYANSPIPQAHGGWTNELKWKNISLNVLFTYSLGRKMICAYRKGSLYWSEKYPLFIDYRNLTFWEKEGDVTDMPKLGFEDEMGADTHVENVHYLRLKTLTLGYDVPKAWMKKTGVEGLRFFFTGENLFLLTNYSGMDPEVVPISGGVDGLKAYPLARKFTLGLTLNF